MKARIKTDFATLYRITERDGTPVELRPGETVPQHADMLRYDLGFCDPKEISKVLFPVFSGKAGRTSPQITRAGLRSACWSSVTTRTRCSRLVGRPTGTGTRTRCWNSSRSRWTST